METSEMAKDEFPPDRDILLLYISDQFKELFGIEKPKKVGGVPLDGGYVDDLLKGIQDRKDPAKADKLLFDHLREVWGDQKTNEELHELIASHMDNMRRVVRNADKITGEATVKCDASSTDDLRNIQLISAKKELLRGYIH